MLQQNPNKNNQDKDLSNSSSGFWDKIQIRGGRFEKRLFIFLIIIVIVAVPLTVWQFSKNLKDPFIIEITETNDNSSDVSYTNTNTSIPLLENLREMDTDEDGLSDYDELYQYKTSPYIQDSDSDSISDSLEVEQGTDPNCPEGTTCSREDSSTTYTNGNTNEEVDLENMSVAQLRQIMIDAGAPEDEVYQIPEEDLLSTYEEILAEEGLTTNTNSDEDILNFNSSSENTNSGSIYSNLDYETLFNLSPDEIRQLLIEGGVPEDELSEVDDETLQEIYQESLYQNFSEVNE